MNSRKPFWNLFIEFSLFIEKEKRKTKNYGRTLPRILVWNNPFLSVPSHLRGAKPRAISI